MIGHEIFFTLYHILRKCKLQKVRDRLQFPIFFHSKNLLTFFCIGDIIRESRTEEARLARFLIPLPARKEFGGTVMYYLKDSSQLRLRFCAMKKFRKNEHHITRIYNYSVLIVMVEGILQFYEDGVLHTLRPGDYYIQRDGLLQEGMNVRHPSAPPSEQPPIYFYMEFRDAEYTEEAVGLPVAGRFSEPSLLPLVSAYENAFFDFRKSNYFLLNSYLYRILSELYSARCEDLSVNRRVSDVMHAVKRYIDSNYANIGSVEEIAKKIGYSPDHMNRLFVQKYQMPVYRYLRHRRMEEAMRLLQNTSMTLLQISQVVGYEEYSSFYRVFVSTYHINPKNVSRRES